MNELHKEMNYNGRHYNIFVEVKGCRQLNRNSTLITLNTSSLDETRQEITHQLDKAKNSYQQQLSLVIDGKTLMHALEHSLRSDFIELCTQCSAVICCRVSPSQKAEMVELVQQHSGAISLAIKFVNRS